jgi:hypothetical protein
MHLPHLPSGLNADVALTSAAGFGTTLSLAASSPIDPANPWSFLSYIPAIVGPALAVLINRYLAAQAARRVARAEFLAAEAKEKQNDDDPKNDAEARALRLEAAELKAEAEALNNTRP